MSLTWLALLLGVIVILYTAFNEEKTYCASCGERIIYDEYLWRTRYPIFIWQWRNHPDPLKCSENGRHEPMRKTYCSHCNERIVDGANGWYSLAKIVNPEFGNPLTCTTTEGHEPR